MNSMRALFLLAIVVLVTGCQNAGARKLAGRWDLLPPDQTATDDVSSNAARMFDSLADGEITGTMSLAFHANGTLETFTDFPMASTGKPKTGRWSTLSWNDQTSVLTIRCEIFDDITQTTIRFVDDDTIQLIPPNIDVLQTELQFRRNQ